MTIDTLIKFRYIYVVKDKKLEAPVQAADVVELRQHVIELRGELEGNGLQLEAQPDLPKRNAT